jgi:hypothetical protein
MSLCTVAELKAALGVGSLYADATLQEVCDAADNVLLPFLWKNDYFNIAHSADDDKRTLYFENLVKGQFYVGQAIVVSGNESLFDGTFTITEVGENSITYIGEEEDRIRPYNLVMPFGKVSAQDQVDYSAVPSINLAALMVAESIWQSRQANSGNGMAPDGSMGSFYAMSSQLISRIRGLIAPYLDPRSMVG